LTKSKIVCLDNNITAFALRDDAHPDDADKAKKAKALLRYLDEQEKIILLPTPVITECLWPVQFHAREPVLNVINKFMIGTFDLAASVKCAEMMHAITPAEKEFKEDKGITKAQMKFDYMIAAIAIVNKAECIYSEDEGLKTFCKGHIEVRSIPPDMPKQGILFNE
jgi:predicted nucleic acid-binding protein